MVAIRFHHSLEPRKINVKGPYNSVLVGSDYVTTEKGDLIAERVGGHWSLVRKQYLGGGSSEFRWEREAGQYYTAFEIFSHDD